MVWYNHKLVTFATVYTITGGFLSSLTATTACVLPDVVEMGGIFKHRGGSHWPYPYLGAALILLITSHFSTSLWPFFAFFLVFGAILHLLEDSLSASGIPWRRPNGHTKGAGFYYTGTASEQMIVLPLIVSLFIICYFRGFLTRIHFESEMQVFVGLFRRLINH